MMTATRDLLDAFDRRPDAERLAFAAEVLRRTSDRDFSPLDDEDPAAADATFQELDAREASDARP